MSKVRAIWASLDFGSTALGIIALLLYGVALVTGFWKALAQFPWYSKVLLGVAVILTVVLAVQKRRQLGLWLGGLVQRPRQQPAGGTTFLHQSGGSIQGSHIDMTQNVGSGRRPPSEPPEPVYSSPTELRQRAAGLVVLGDELIAFRAAQEPEARAAWDKYRGQMPLLRAHFSELGRLYRTQFDARVAHACEDARSRGFPDDYLGSEIRILQSMGEPHFDMFGNVAQRLKVLAIRMNERADEMDRGGA